MKSFPTRPLVIGHRGWPARYPDNTLTGLIAAGAISDMVEVDVRRAGDGKLVLSHDPTLGDLAVTGHPWSVLGEVDLGGGHRPALLDEALAALPDTPVLLEVKNGPDGYEPDHRLALETADRARPGDVVISFNWASVDLVRSTYPETATGLVVGTSDAMADAIRLCFDAGHQVLVPRQDLLEVTVPDLIVYPWTVDDPNRARELVDLGVSGIITNVPDLVREVI
jgi:glycerophosphoryl diester phosphodiesterase